MNETTMLEVIQKVVERVSEATFVPVGVSNRHVHLSQADIDVLYGKGHQLTKFKDLKQPGQYAAEEVVTVVGSKGELERVRVLGPARPNTQVELSISDGFKIGVKLSVKESGDINGTPGVTLKGPKGSVAIKEGAIAAYRHIHMPKDLAMEKGFTDGQLVSVKTIGLRAVTFHQVMLRVSEKYALEMHLDVEEANTAGVKNNDLLEIVK